MKRSDILFPRAFLAALAAFALVSCSDYLSPVKDYLEEYTTSAGIGTHSIVTEWRKDSAQIANLPSASAARIRFLMRNPRNYTIDYGIAFADPDVNSGVSSPADYEFVTASDRQSFELVLYPGFLRSNEGKDLSATISISDNLTSRPFEPYHFALASNTAPPVPQGPLAMISSGGSNVVCFNLDLSDAIHGDIDAVLINGAEYPVVSVSAGSSQSLSFDASSPATTVAPSGMQAHAGTTDFVAANGMTAVYVETGDSAATPKNYLVSVRDKRGLLSSATISSNPNQLGQVLVMDANGQLVANLPNATLVIPSNGTTTSVVLNGPTGSTLYWSYTKDATTPDTGTSATIPHTLSLSPGNYSLTAYARMAGYSDSDPVTVNFKVITTINEVYVNPSSGNDSNIGDSHSPVQTIGQAVQMLSNLNDPTNTIHLMDDVPETAPSSYPDDVVHLEFNHDAQFTLVGFGSMRSIVGGNVKRCLYISSASNVVKVTLTSLNINHGMAKNALPYGGGIYFDAPAGGSSLTLDNCDIWNNGINNTSRPIAGGGGVYARCSSVSLVNGSTIRENKISSTSIARGAGLCVEGSGTVDILDSSFSANATTSSVTSEGAGLYCAGVSVSAPITCTIVNSTIKDNHGSSSDTGYGGGIYAENAMVTISSGSILQSNNANIAKHGKGGGIYAYNANVTISSGEILDNNATCSNLDISATGYGGGICFVKNQGSPALTITNTTVMGNTCSITGLTIYGRLAGAGIYVVGTGSTPTIVSLTGGAITNNITNPNATVFSNADGGMGGGICLLDRVQATIDGTSITGNVANNFASETGKGGGIYFDSQSLSDASLTIKNAAIISGNTASKGNGGAGGGIYLKSDSGGKIAFSLEGGTIQGNYASTSNGTGQGGGIYATSANPAAKLSVSISGGSVTSNMANSLNGAGYGGGIYSGTNTSLTVSGGNISNNLGSATGTSEGDGLQLVGSLGNTTQFSLSASSIGTNNASSVTNQAINITSQYVETTFTKDAKVDSSALVVLNSNATISTSGYLTQDPVAKISLAFTGQSDVLTGDTRLNYYKFLMETPGLCVNASGKKSTIAMNYVSNFGDLFLALQNSPLPTDGSTVWIEVTVSTATVNSGTVITIPTGANVRIVPTVAMALSMDFLGTFIQVQQGGHLLFGAPTATTTLNYLATSNRTGNTIDTGQNSSLVLRNVTIANAAVNSVNPASAALVRSGASGTIVLEEFNYADDPSNVLNSKDSAIMLAYNSLCHFVSGSIRYFNNNGTMSGHGGVAHLDTGAALIIHSGTFEWNTLIGDCSVTGYLIDSTLPINMY